MEEASASMAIRMMSCSESKPNGDEILGKNVGYLTNNNKKFLMWQNFSVP
jgi:hypothetical protein